MNDKSKFRGKRIDNDEWVVGNLLLPEKKVNGNGKCFIGIPFGFLPTNTICEVYPESVSRFTGFYSKLIQEIYFKDVVREWIEDEVEEKGGFWWYGVVAEINGCTVIKQIGFDYSHSKFPDDFTFLYSEASTIEVIGKLFDKPKLKRQSQNKAKNAKTLKNGV